MVYPKNHVPADHLAAMKPGQSVFMVQSDGMCLNHLIKNDDGTFRYSKPGGFLDGKTRTSYPHYRWCYPTENAARAACRELLERAAVRIAERMKFMQPI